MSDSTSWVCCTYIINSLLTEQTQLWDDVIQSSVNVKTTVSHSHVVHVTVTHKHTYTQNTDVKRHLLLFNAPPDNYWHYADNCYTQRSFNCPIFFAHHKIKPENPLDWRGRGWHFRQVSKSNFSTVWPWLWPPDVKSWTFHSLVTRTTCANLQQHQFTHFWNITLTLKVKFDLCRPSVTLSIDLLTLKTDLLTLKTDCFIPSPLGLHMCQFTPKLVDLFQNIVFSTTLYHTIGNKRTNEWTEQTDRSRILYLRPVQTDGGIKTLRELLTWHLLLAS